MNWDVKDFEMKLVEIIPGTDGSLYKGYSEPSSYKQGYKPPK